MDAPDQPQGNLVGGAVEYPIVTGVFMWFAGLFARNDADYLRVTALLLAPFGLLTAGMLAKLSGRRAFIWAAAPALVLYSVHNWDFLATATVVGAVWAWSSDRLGLAAALLGLGAATKIYPGFFALPLLLEQRVRPRHARRGQGGRRHGRRLAADQPAVPAGQPGRAGGRRTRSRSGRVADLTTNSIWYWGFPHLAPSTVDHWSLALVALSWLVAVGRRLGLAGRTGSYPWLQVSAAMLCGFLLFNKVYSPQYVLWLLPFFVLLRVRWGWWASYLAVDVLLYVGLFRWYYDITQGGDFGAGQAGRGARRLGQGRAAGPALRGVPALVAVDQVRDRQRRPPTPGQQQRPAVLGPVQHAAGRVVLGRAAGPVRRPDDVQLGPQHVPDDQRRQAPARRRRAAAPRRRTSRSRRPWSRCRGTTAAAGSTPGTR